MGDPGAWCLLIAGTGVALTLFFSTLHLALRHVSWVKLEGALESQTRQGDLKWIRARLSKLLFITASMRLLVNVLVVLSLLYYLLLLSRPLSEGLIGYLARAGAIAFVILAVFSEGLPQVWAKYRGTPVLASSVRILRVLYGLMWPLTVVLTLFEPLVQRLVANGREAVNGRMAEKQEELLSVVEEGEKEGVVDEEERNMIASVLEFRGTTAGEIMTPRTDVIGIEINADFAGTVELVIRKGHSRYPVYEESIDKITGMLYAKDLLRHFNGGQVPSDIRPLLRPPTFVPESKVLRELLHDFQDKKNHIAVVLDEYGGTAGVVTIEDILEELVGEIVDEYEDPQAAPLEKINDETYEIDAGFHVDELNDELELSVPEDEDYETVGGFAFAQLEHIPKAGESFKYENLTFTVIDAGARRINRLRLHIQPKPAPPGRSDPR